MGCKGLRHIDWIIKKPPFFWAASSLSFWSSLGAFGFGEPPVVIMCRGDNGHDDGNKGYKREIEDHRKTGVKLSIGPGPVNLRFSDFRTIVRPIVTPCSGTQSLPLQRENRPQLYHF